MNHQPQQPVSACSLAIGMGATMGAGIGGSAGVCIGGFTGFFSGYRGMSLIKHAGKWVFCLLVTNKSILGVQWPWVARLQWWCRSHRGCVPAWTIECTSSVYLLVQFVLITFMTSKLPSLLLQMIVASRAWKTMLRHSIRPLSGEGSQTLKTVSLS